MIEATGKLEAEDYVQAQYLHIRPRLAFKILGVLIAGLCLWAMWYSFFGDDSPGFNWSDLIIPAGVAYFVAQFFVYVPWKTRRIYHQQKSLKREAHMRFDDTGLSAENEMGQGTTPWADYVKWKENERLFLLYISDPFFHMIPKRLFDDPGDIERLRKIFSEKIGPAKA